MDSSKPSDWDLKWARAEVVEAFISIESLTGSIICQHYFGEVRTDFVDDFLHDEYCSFGLKRRILEKVVKNMDPTIVHKLNRLSAIRNYFAHCGDECFDGLTIPEPGQRGYTPDPRRRGGTIDFRALHDEFFSLAPAISSYLFDTFRRMGGWVILPGEKQPDDSSPQQK